MRGILGYLGMSIGGAAGWWLGNLHGLMLAVLLSAVGSGVGLYYGRKWAEDFLE